VQEGRMCELRPFTTAARASSSSSSEEEEEEEEIYLAQTQQIKCKYQ